MHNRPYAKDSAQICIAKLSMLSKHTHFHKNISYANDTTHIS